MSVSTMFLARNSRRPRALFPQTACLLFSARLTQDQLRCKLTLHQWWNTYHFFSHSHGKQLAKPSKLRASSPDNTRHLWENTLIETLKIIQILTGFNKNMLKTLHVYTLDLTTKTNSLLSSSFGDFHIIFRSKK